MGRKSTELLFRSQPPLELFGLPGKEAERLDVISPRKHPAAYAVAAFAYHHGHRLDDAGRRALLGMLLALWPRVPGRRPDEYANHAAYVLKLLRAPEAETDPDAQAGAGGSGPRKGCFRRLIVSASRLVT